jgi:hypothetical protein
MPQKGNRLMAIQIARSNKSPVRRAPGFIRHLGFELDWEERMMTAVATVVALMIVAAVAILIGMV